MKRFLSTIIQGLFIISFAPVSACAEFVIDDFSSINAWHTTCPPEAAIQVTQARDGDRNIMRMEFDLGETHTYAVALRNLNRALPENYEIVFPVKGAARRNNFEFKVVDADGNTFLKVWRKFRVTTNWTPMRVKRRDLRFGWGPNPKAQPDQISRIEFAVASGRGGKGYFLIGPITLRELAPEPPELLPTAKASSGNNPENAVDGSYATRWRSKPFDPQWIEVDFKKPREMAGLRLFWENYGDYDVALSSDGTHWTPVYAMNNADGGLDEIFFSCVTAQYVRIETRKQAKRDGYSLAEIEIVEPSEKPSAQASSSREGNPATYMLDGNTNTLWRSEKDGRQWIQVDFHEVRDWGGLVIHWGDDYASSYRVEASTNGLYWWTVYAATNQNGGTDRIFLNETESRLLRVTGLQSAGKNGYAIREIEIKAPEEAMTVTKFYQLAASGNPGCYPRWLLNEQAYWTIFGTPEDVREAAICEDGTLEPHKRGFTIMPILRVGSRLVTREEAAVDQSLLDDYIPIPSVHWKYDDLTLDITALAHGGAASSAYARYILKNNGTSVITGNLYLVIHPIQVYPPWQGGHDGFSRIKSLSYSNGVASLDGNRKVFFLTPPPQRFAAKGGTFQIGRPPEGDIADNVANGNLPVQTSAKDTNGFVSGAAEFPFSLAPGESRKFYIAIPLHETLPHLSPAMNAAAIATDFEKMLREIATRWRDEVDGVTFEVPDPALVNMLKANIAYNLITKDGPGFQPGSRSYDKAWMRDGSIAALALLKMGYTNEIREFIAWFAAYQFDSGEIPPIIDSKNEDPIWEETQRDLHEFDSQGQFVHLVYEYYSYTRDKPFLREMYPQVIDALRFLQTLRERRATPEFRDNPEKQEFYNILPPSRSHEGYWLAHSYWDDFWALKGWKDGVRIAEIMGKPEDADWMRKEYETLKTGVYESMKRVMKKHGIDYIPGCAEKGDFDATSTAVGIVYCDELDNMPQPQTANTFNRFYKELSKRFEPDAQFVFTPYEVRTVLAYLFMGQKERALNLLNFLIDCRRPPGWYHLAEVVHSGYRFPCYIGDMPHTWVGAGLINSIRGLFLYEDGDTLVIGAGVDPKWIEEGKQIRILNAPTRFGKMNIEMHRNGKDVLVELSGDAVPPDGIILKSPLREPATSVTINGKPSTSTNNNEILIQNLPAEIIFSS